MNNSYMHYFEGSVSSKLATARRLWKQYGDLFLADPLITVMLDDLATANHQLVSHMEHMEMPALCTICAANARGGCCSSLMADNTDAVLLFINMLGGKTVVMRKSDRDQCCFLGQHGCSLTIKPMFCLNYNCSRITDRASPTDMNRLERLTGALLHIQLTLEQHIIHRVRTYTEEHSV